MMMMVMTLIPKRDERVSKAVKLRMRREKHVDDWKCVEREWIAELFLHHLIPGSL